MGERLVWLSNYQKSSLVKLSILVQVWSDFSKLIFLPCLWARLDLVHVYLQSNHRLNSEKSFLLAVPVKLSLSSVGNTVSVFFSEVMYNSMFHIFRGACITVFLMSVLICICNFLTDLIDVIFFDWTFCGLKGSDVHFVLVNCSQCSMDIFLIILLLFSYGIAT